MTIYSLMNKVRTLGFYTTLAAKCYREGKQYYSCFEDKALASLDTLLDVDYISRDEYTELTEQLSHVFRMYKRH